jgi:small redox-active disulfide protein 2
MPPKEDRSRSRVQVLGPGCHNCEVLYERTKQAAREAGFEGEIEKVSDIDVIVGLGVLTTPALVVDGAVKVSGRVPTVAQIKEMLA